MLPDIKISLPILFVLWCGFGYWAMGQNPVMLAYPAMWAAVVLLFFAVTKLAGPASADPAGDA
ncbi:hypothetical protein MalM25_30620 [Planctomycetes bacterium MalM25]|nr:hypothetical protein MalM25_30620 [Planctomycetes bacterium MalM25]